VAIAAEFRSFVMSVSLHGLDGLGPFLLGRPGAGLVSRGP
jgi:hypothetical protein